MGHQCGQRLWMPLVAAKHLKSTGAFLQVAIKFMQRGEKLSSVYVQREIENHSGLLHPHIIQFKEVLPPACHEATGLPGSQHEQGLFVVLTEEVGLVALHAGSRRSFACRECRMMPRILSAQVFLTPDYLAIVMEYAKGGDMFQYVKARRGLQVCASNPTCLHHSNYCSGHTPHNPAHCRQGILVPRTTRICLSEHACSWPGLCQDPTHRQQDVGRT